MSHKKKTLVILTPGFAKDESDTTCLPMQQSFVRSFNKYYPGINIIILAFQYPYETKTYQWFGNTVISFNGRNRGGLPKLFLFQKWNAALRKINREHDIVGLLSFWYGDCALAGKRFGARYGIKHFCWILGQDARKGNRYVSITKLKAGELIALSDFLADEFERNYGFKPLHTVTPGIDVNEFATNDVTRDIDILATGSLIPLKQYDVFVDVIARLKTKFPLIRAALVGDGPEKSRLQDQINSLGLRSNIMLTGELAHPDVLKWMQRSKVFLHTSSYEGFVVVCLEALCAGAQVISFVKPMHTAIKKWHTVATKDEMINIASNLLEDPDPDNRSLIPYPMDQTVKGMAELFSL